MSYENISIENRGRTRVITIERPKQLNALNKATIAELSAAIEQAESDSDVRAVILTGSGDKAFVAGADIKEFAGFDVEQGKTLAAEGQRLLFDKVAECGTPFIAAVNGFALGGGLELAMSCHFRVASTNARLGLPEVSLGVIPGYGGTQRLAQLVGKGKALEMICTAGMVDAQDAKDWGLVNHVVSPEELMTTCEKLAAKVAKNSPMAIAEAIHSVNAGYQDGVDGFQAEIDAFGRCFGTPEFIEGTTAFMEKRKADF